MKTKGKRRKTSETGINPWMKIQYMNGLPTYMTDPRWMLTHNRGHPSLRVTRKQGTLTAARTRAFLRLTIGPIQAIETCPCSRHPWD